MGPGGDTITFFLRTFREKVVTTFLGRSEKSSVVIRKTIYLQGVYVCYLQGVCMLKYLLISTHSPVEILRRNPHGPDSETAE